MDHDTFNILKDAAAGMAVSSLVWFSLLVFFAGTNAAKTKHPTPDIPFTDFGCKCEKDKYVKGAARTWKLTVWAINEDTHQRWERVYSQYPIERPDAVKKTLEDCRNWMGYIEKHYHGPMQDVPHTEPSRVSVLM
jgi:hypothetical protein